MLSLLVDGTLAQIALDGLSPGQILNTAAPINKKNAMTFSTDIQRMQNVLIQHMPLDETNRILNAFLKVITGESREIRDQGEVCPPTDIARNSIICIEIRLFFLFVFSGKFTICSLKVRVPMKLFVK